MNYSTILIMAIAFISLLNGAMAGEYRGQRIKCEKHDEQWFVDRKNVRHWYDMEVWTGFGKPEFKLVPCEDIEQLELGCSLSI